LILYLNGDITVLKNFRKKFRQQVLYFYVEIVMQNYIGRRENVQINYRNAQDFNNFEQEIKDDQTERIIHFYPESDDVNAQDRLTLLRGIAAGLSVLYHSFSDPIKLLEEIEMIEKQEALKKENSPF
jgi:hypothetical protein